MRALLTAALFSAAPSLAKGEGGGIRDGSYHVRPFQISLFAVAPYLPHYFGPDGFGIGGAARFTIPLVHNGFIRSINDSFELELGGNVYTSWRVNGVIVTPVVEVRWTFHLTHHFSAYPKLGFGLNVPLQRPGAPPPGPHVSALVGILYEVVDWFYLRAEAGYPGLLLGVAFAF